MTSARNAGIYVASRASNPARPAMWRALRAAGWPIVSSWIDEAGEGQTEDFTELWERIGEEIRSSAGLIVYAEPEDFPLKGAYLEAGIALGAGLPVAVVLPGVQLEPRTDRPMGSWIRHPGVQMCATLEEARAAVEAASNCSSHVNVIPPAEPDALRQSIAELEAWDGSRMCDEPLTLSEIESVALVLHELKRLRAAAATLPGAAADVAPRAFIWPQSRHVGRQDDMNHGHLRVGLDIDNDVYVAVFDGIKGNSAGVEFCNPGGGGGGRSARTRLALIELMKAIEADNAESPRLAFPSST